jgi:hypothetical protein
MTTSPVLILDNGAYNIKAGYSGIDWEPRVFPNSIARSRAERKVLVADEIEGCRDLSGIAYRRPFEKVCQRLGVERARLIARACWSIGMQRRSSGTDSSRRRCSMSVLPPGVRRSSLIMAGQCTRDIFVGHGALLQSAKHSRNVRPNGIRRMGVPKLLPLYPYVPEQCSSSAQDPLTDCQLHPSHHTVDYSVTSTTSPQHAL